MIVDVREKARSRDSKDTKDVWGHCPPARRAVLAVVVVL
jgi:hypothetical protein